jgi:predicted outer membrane repeat protein
VLNKNKIQTIRAVLFMEGFVKRFLLTISCILVSFLLAFSIVTLARAATIWYVALTGDDANICASPSAPCASLNGALAKAAAGDTIYVAVGEYRDPGGLPITIGQDITILGGWDETFTRQTGLSTINADGHRGIIINSGVNATLEYLVIRNGKTVPMEYQGGGGIFNNGNLIIRHSKVIENIAYSYGGGIASYGDLTVEDCEFRHNNAQYDYAGAIQIKASHRLIIRQSVIAQNSANRGGGGIEGQDARILIEGSSITGNSATVAGGGGLRVSGNSLLTITNSSIVGNQICLPVACYGGGGIYFENTTCAYPNCGVELNNVTISGNSASKGGGIYAGSNVHIRNTILAGNYASVGGRIVTTIAPCFRPATT